jgi:ubiquinone biosynthesis protein
MTAGEVRATIEHELGELISAHAIHIDSAILSEASVSAVVRFTWRDPSGRHRRRGVFKVLKPHVPEYFIEDMQMLQDLADFFATHRTEYGPVARVLPDTFAKVRRLLQHEVDFTGEQATLRRAVELYRSMDKVQVPHLIPELSTPAITAMTEVPGAKIVDAAARVPVRKRARIAERLVEALVAVPLFSSDTRAMFHADPHAGNLLYGEKSGELAIVDWALKEELTDEQRRRLALLTITVTLRDPIGAAEQVVRLAETRIHPHSRRAHLVRDVITHYFDELPVTRITGVVDAMRILEQCALNGILFPAPLIMFSKMMFTLEDVLDDIGDDRSSISTIMGRYLLSRLISSRSLRKSGVTLPLKKKDWLALPLSATFGALRLGLRIEQAAFEALLSRFAPPQPQSTPAS